MKQMIRIVFGVSVAWLLTALAPQAGAQVVTQWWDTASGSGLTAGNANWDTTAAAWAGTSNPGTATPGLWTNGNFAVFAAPGASAVTVYDVTNAGMSFAGASASTFLPGSGVLTITGAVTIGNASSNNTVTLAPGMTWNAATNTALTVGSGGTGNVLIVDGGNFTNIATMTINSNNTLSISNGAYMYVRGNITLNGGTLNVGGPGTYSTFTNSTSGVGATADAAQTFYIYSGSTIVVTNGLFFNAARVVSSGTSQGQNNILINVLSKGTFVINNSSGGDSQSFGWDAGANGNRIVVDSGTFIDNTANGFVIGVNDNATAKAFSNSLTVVNGGTVQLLTAFTLGQNAVSNSFNMGGYGNISTGSCATLTIGSSGAFANTMTVTNAVLTSAAATIGSGAGASSNSVYVNGGGLWKAGGNTITVGSGATTGNVLVVNAGGVVSNAVLVVGSGDVNSINNSVTVNNLGTIDLAGGNLGFGGGSGNVLTVNPGGLVTNVGGLSLVGQNLDFTMTNNTLIGTGADPMTQQVYFVNSTLGTLGALNVGATAGLGGNRLTLTNLLYTANAASTIGNGGNNNTLAVLPNTVWNNNGKNITIGSGTAAGNVLTVNGGVVTNVGAMTIGTAAGSVTNGLSIINNGQWYGGAVYVGASGVSNYYNVGGSGAPVTVTNSVVWLSNSTQSGAGTYSMMTVTNANLTLGIPSAYALYTLGASSTIRILANATVNTAGGPGSHIGGLGSSVVINGGTLRAGSGYMDLYGGDNVSMTISNGGQFHTTGPIQMAWNGENNIVYNVGGLGAQSIVTNGAIQLGRPGAFAVSSVLGPTVNVTNVLFTSGALNIVAGAFLNCKLFTVNVYPNTTWNLTGNAITIIGTGTNNSRNSLNIYGGIVTNVGAISLGNASSYNNWITITNCQLWSAGNVTIAGTSNSVTVANNGLWDLGSGNITINAGLGNVITNSGGVYQFTTATPAITNNAAAGSIALNNGVISFRGVNGVNVKGNWPGGGSQLTNMTFYGANAFRLNNSTNLANTATNQTYWFDSGAGFGATNYAGLEMISDVVGGGTAYTNGSVTIGTNGWLTYSNTTAIMWGAVTNYGKMRFYNSSVTFKTNLVLAEGSTLIWTSNSLITVNGTLTLPTSMTFSNASSSTPSDDWLVLTNAIGAINGSPAAWTGLPKYQRVSKNGNTLRLIPRLPGSLFYVE